MRLWRDALRSSSGSRLFDNYSLSLQQKKNQFFSDFCDTNFKIQNMLLIIGFQSQTSFQNYFICNQKAQSLFIMSVCPFVRPSACLSRLRSAGSAERTINKSKNEFRPTYSVRFQLKWHNSESELTAVALWFFFSQDLLDWIVS